MVDFNGKWPPDRDELARLLGTSALIEGCILSSDGTILTMTAGIATFNYIEPANNIFRSSGQVNVPSITDPSPPYTGNIQHVYLNEQLEFEYELDLKTATLPNQKRIYIGALITNGVDTIVSVVNLTDTSQTNIPEAIRDLQYTLKPLRKAGLEIGADSINPLQVEMQAGEVLILSGFVKSVEFGGSANILSVPNFTIPGYFYTYRDGVGGWIVDFTKTEITPGSYDDGSGTLANVGNNRWSIQRLYGDENLDLFIHYGQERYNSFNNALRGLETEPFEKNPLNEFSYFVGYLLIRGNCNDIDNTSRCVIILPPFVNGERNVTT